MPLSISTTEGQDSSLRIANLRLRCEVEEDILPQSDVVQETLHEIAAKRCILNNLLPVARLLPELLTAIFMYFAMDPSTYTARGFKTGPYSWIVVTHVCHRWRSIALNTPKLWSYIYPGALNRVEEFLARSDQVALHIRHWDWVLPTTYQASLNAVLVQLSRIQELCLVRVPNNVLEHVFAAVDMECFNAPALKLLKFIGIRDSSFPNILNKCTLPALKSIEIRGYSIPWELPILHLDLTNLVLHPSLPDSSLLGKVLNALFYMPSLQTFELIREQCDGSCKSQSYGVLRSVELLRLQKLHLRLDVNSVDAFMLHCTVSPSAVIRLNTVLSHPHPLPNNPDLIRSIIANSLTLDTAIPLTGLAIRLKSTDSDFRPPCSYQVVIRTYNVEPSSIDIMLPPPNFSLFFSLRDVTMLPEVLQQILLDLPLSEVLYLSMERSPSFRLLLPFSRELAKFLARLIARCSPSGLEILNISGLCITILDSLLSLPLHDWLQLTTGWCCADRVKGLFGCLKMLVLGETRRVEMYPYLESKEQAESLCEAIRGQYYYDQRDVLLNVVDAVAELCYQEGRFTENLQFVPYTPLSPWSFYYDVFPNATNHPNCDSDFCGSNNLVDPTEGDWVDHACSGARVTFDFRGDTGITIENPAFSSTNEDL
ncbi:unnamed protein product [Somion occarium]|uniref:F-box domain-containing protein n=1 Tax=Somion occarium TaxID=3059160 RepID=A0ABP1E830_9APHY